MDSDVLKNYKPRAYPTIEAGLPQFTKEELQRISTAVNLLVDVLKQIDARCVAGGI
jgi:hypothetical protein